MGLIRKGRHCGPSYRRPMWDSSLSCYFWNRFLPPLNGIFFGFRNFVLTPPPLRFFLFQTVKRQRTLKSVRESCLKRARANTRLLRTFADNYRARTQRSFGALQVKEPHNLSIFLHKILALFWVTSGYSLLGPMYHFGYFRS